MYCTIYLPSVIKQKITLFYQDLFDKRKSAMPQDKSYTKRHLQSNINKACSIDQKTINTDIDLRQPNYQPWLDNKWKEIVANHWFYAVTIQKGKNGKFVASIQDAHHENDNHNDTLHTDPYVDESIRKILSLMERVENLPKRPPVK